MALTVKKSRLPGAGKGLFTTTAIAPDTKIIQYRGELLDYKEFHRRERKGNGGYMFYLKGNHYIDAMHTPQYKARYANDAAGLGRIKGIRNNCDYMVFNNKCYIVSSRHIKAGEEIYVNYTKPYWDNVKKQMKLKAIKLKQKLKKEQLRKEKNKQTLNLIYIIALAALFCA
ncbi:MAG: SET domain-containing protein [Bacteroidia bacterium]|nr:SET domain-containing protein [Bacteroidia bacterium]